MDSVDAEFDNEVIRSVSLEAKESEVIGSVRFPKTDRTRWKESRRTTWFWRGVFVSAVANSFLAAADLNVQEQSVWAELGESIELHSATPPDATRRLLEVELTSDEAVAARPEVVLQASEKKVREDERTISGLVFPPTSAVAKAVQSEDEARDDAEEAQENLQTAFAPQPGQPVVAFPVDVPRSEVLRVSQTFQGMVQQALNESGGQYAQKFVGTLALGETISDERLAELETTLIDEVSESEDGYSLGEEVSAEVEGAGLDPFKTYTVVNGRIRAVAPVQSVRAPASAAASAPVAAVSALAQPQVQPEQIPSEARVVVARNGAAPLVVAQNSSASAVKALELPAEQVQKELAKIVPESKVAALESNPTDTDRVTVRGRVVVPSGFSPDRAVLRMAGTGFQVQTDASGAFELRDVPRDTRFELVTWHLDGGLTRRLVPVVASGREKNIEVHLQRTRDIDQLANAFGVVHPMNAGGFCARVEHELPAAVAGGVVTVNAFRKNLQAHFFSANGLPVPEMAELSEDGRFCVFNVEDDLVDVRVVLLNGTRRHFVVHVEPSTFEHDLVFDVSESIYRKISLLEPLDTQQVLELSAQGVQPEFGDKRLKDWLVGEDVPVWTKVSRFLMQSDASYGAIRPAADDVQFFPGGQEIVEVRLSADHPGAPTSRVLLARDQLMTTSMLKRIESLKTRIHQDRQESVSVPALDADAWDDIVTQNVDVPHLQDQTVGGVYFSIDTTALGYRSEDLVLSVRETWSGKDACKVVPLRGLQAAKSTRYLRAVCGAAPGQYAFVVESRDGALVWSDIVRIRPGDVQTVTVLDPKF